MRCEIGGVKYEVVYQGNRVALTKTFAEARDVAKRIIKGWARDHRTLLGFGLRGYYFEVSHVPGHYHCKVDVSPILPYIEIEVRPVSY